MSNRHSLSIQDRRATRFDAIARCSCGWSKRHNYQSAIDKAICGHLSQVESRIVRSYIARVI